MSKTFRPVAGGIQSLARGLGACMATDRITVDGLPVRFMYRSEPDDTVSSGWVFTSGTEDQSYMDDASNLALYSVNTIANYDPTIIPLLSEPVGSAFEKEPGATDFVRVENWAPED